MLHNLTTILTTMEDLTRRHLHTVSQTYQYASICAHAMKHVRDLRWLYDRALGAKSTYHTTLSTYIPDQIHITRTHQRWLQHVADTTKAYYAAKQASLTIYVESATTMGLCKRY